MYVCWLSSKKVDITVHMHSHMLALLIKAFCYLASYTQDNGVSTCQQSFVLMKENTREYVRQYSSSVLLRQI